MGGGKEITITRLPQFHGFWEKHRYKVAVSGRASGKSVAAADAIITFMAQFPVKVLCARQFQNSIADSSYQQLIDRIEDHGLSEQFEILRDRINCKLTGATAVFRGLERNIRNIKSMANIDICWVEEAEAVSDESWQVLIPTIMRNKGAEMWVCFNPKLPTDPTAELFLGENPPPGTHLMRANYDENPFLDEGMLSDIAHMRTHDYKRYLHVYQGQFEDVGDNKIFPLELVRSAADRDWHHSEESCKIAALDVARFGDDSSVFLVRDNNRVTDIFKWYQCDTLELARRASEQVLSESITVLVIDNGGGHGSGVIDLLRSQIGNVCKIVEFHGAMSANDSRYNNARTETHFLAKEWLEKGSIPCNQDLIAELTSLEYDFTNTHRMKVEEKKEIKKRIGKSPDHSDAFTMTFFSSAVRRSKKKPKVRRARTYHWI